MGASKGFFSSLLILFIAGLKALEALLVAGTEGGSPALCFARGEAKENLGDVSRVVVYVSRNVCHYFVCPVV